MARAAARIFDPRQSELQQEHYRRLYTDSRHFKAFTERPKRFGAAKRFAIGTNFPVILEIRKHHSGKDIEPFAGLVAPEYTRQREVLFQKKARFKVVAEREIDLGEKKGYFIELDEINE